MSLLDTRPRPGGRHLSLNGRSQGQSSPSRRTATAETGSDAAGRRRHTPPRSLTSKSRLVLLQTHNSGPCACGRSTGRGRFSKEGPGPSTALLSQEVSGCRGHSQNAAWMSLEATLSPGLDMDGQQPPCRGQSAPPAPHHLPDQTLSSTPRIPTQAHSLQRSLPAGLFPGQNCLFHLPTSWRGRLEPGPCHRPPWPLGPHFLPPFSATLRPLPRSIWL